MMSVEPLTPTIGAEIKGIDLRRHLSEETMRDVERALLEWRVLFFRDQRIEVDDQRRFARWFGDLEIHPLTPPWQPNADLVRVEEDNERRAHNDIWHSDLTFKETPPLGSILRAREMPEVGGDTLFADMYAAYEGLDDATKQRVEGAVAIHDFHPFRRSMRARGVPEGVIDQFKKRYPPAHHPVVRTHPRTGRKCLFVNVLYTKRIAGMDEDESDALLAHLCRQAWVPEYQCRFKWKPDSIAFWDNRCTQHYAVADYHPRRRVVERITVCGDKPF